MNAAPSTSPRGRSRKNSAIDCSRKTQLCPYQLPRRRRRKPDARYDQSQLRCAMGSTDSRVAGDDVAPTPDPVIGLCTGAALRAVEGLGSDQTSAISLPSPSGLAPLRKLIKFNASIGARKLSPSTSKYGASIGFMGGKGLP